MSELVLVEGKHAVKTAHCALVLFRIHNLCRHFLCMCFCLFASLVVMAVNFQIARLLLRHYWESD